MLLVEHASATAIAALREAGIRSILIKGPLQQVWLGPSGPPRASVDVDLLVDPADVEPAGKALSALGYYHQPEVTAGVEHHGDRWAVSGRVPVEVHWTLSGADRHRMWAAMRHETEDAEMAGATVEIPSEPARCLIVALHAAQHGPEVHETHYDLQRAVVVAGRDSWKRAAELAREVGAEVAFVTGLGLVAAGARLRSDLGLQSQPLTEGLALNIVGDMQGAPGFHWLAQQKGMRAKAAFVARKIVPPADFMRFKYPFARKGRRHLALTYLYRPLWIARWSLPGFLAWRRSRRAVKASRGRHG